MILCQFYQSRGNYPLSKIGKNALHDACKSKGVEIASDLLDYGGIQELFQTDDSSKLPFEYLSKDERSQLFSKSVFGKFTKFRFDQVDFKKKARRTRKTSSLSIQGDKIIYLQKFRGPKLG